MRRNAIRSPHLCVKQTLDSLFDIQQVQKKIYEETPIKNGKVQPQFQQMALNLSYVATTEEEFMVINRSIHKILDWKPFKIPYLVIHVKNAATRRAILNRTGILLASFADMPPCCIGIRIAPDKCEEELCTTNHVTALRRAIWGFLLNELTRIPPHVRSFLNMELKILAWEEIPSTPPTFGEQPVRQNHIQTPEQNGITSLEKITIESVHDKYVQELRTWEKSVQLKENREIRPVCRHMERLRKFKNYASITKLIDIKNAHWQIDTVEILLKRGETHKGIQSAIRLQPLQSCDFCDGQIHTTWNCPLAKQRAQKRRYELSRNERKDNQTGEYANHAPFQLLKDTLIPKQVFEFYENNFIPSHSD